ncbi:MAG TPA: histidine--tRNA ligase [Gammaproteobacteria bacterium]|nr:histidine--tRNA ligase [Gammaproteobacteria bacterium]
MTEKIKSIRGMPTLLPAELERWQSVESVIKGILSAYAFKEIRTPLLERTELFQRTIGEQTDVVSKEMYSFLDRKDQSLSLRPEATAGVVRAGIEHGLFYNQTQKLWSMGPMYRYERPQKGRYRQFHQVNMEAFGFEGPSIDAELILLTSRIWKKLGVDSIQLELNSLGTLESRKAYRSILVEYFKDHIDTLDEDSLLRLEKNPMRILDSKNPEMSELNHAAPKMSDHLDQESQDHFSGLLERLNNHGIDYVLNPRLVRGLDYYTKTVFEWTTDKLGSQATVCGGGRYDGLVKQLGGHDIFAIGCAIGFERLVELVELSNKKDQNGQPKIYFVAVGDNAEAKSSELAELIRDQFEDCIIEINHSGGSFKQQFKRADRSESDIALILGDEEIQNETIGIKAMKQGGEQETISMAKLLEGIAERIDTKN